MGWELEMEDQVAVRNMVFSVGSRDKSRQDRWYKPDHTASVLIRMGFHLVVAAIARIDLGTA